MKKLLVISALMAAAVLSAHAQGRVVFSSAFTGVNAKFVTSVHDFEYGPSNALTFSLPFRADLWWAPGSTTVGVLPSDLTTPALYNNHFADVAAQAGYFTGGTKTLTGWVSGPVVAVVRVWDISVGDYQANLNSYGGRWFESPMFVITPTVSPTAAPALIGLGNGVVYFLNFNVPEPATFTLAGLGAAAMWIMRRRR